MTNTQHKVALVTGGARGIGAAIVRRLAKDGFDVAFSYVNSKSKAEGLVEEIRAIGGHAVAIQADSASAEDVKKLIATTLTTFGRLDVLVNNAATAVLGPLDAFSLDDFDKLVAVNIRGVFVATQEAVKHMGDGGRIINIGSCTAKRVPSAGSSVYAMTKAAVAGLTRGLARDLGPRGITVVDVQPGPTDTDMNPANGEHVEKMWSLMALRRHGQAHEIAGMVSFLAGPDGGFVTGASLTIDGGFST